MFWLARARAGVVSGDGDAGLRLLPLRCRKRCMRAYSGLEVAEPAGSERDGVGEMPKKSSAVCIAEHAAQHCTTVCGKRRAFDGGDEERSQRPLLRFEFFSSRGEIAASFARLPVA